MSTPLKTLVIRFSSVGDIVLSTPMLRVLRARFPASQIDYVTRKEYAELVRSNQNLNLTFELDAAQGFAGLRELTRRLKSERYDLVVDLHDSLRSRYLRTFVGAGERVVVNKRLAERFLLVRFKKNIYPNSVSVADRYIEPLQRFGVANDGRGLELNIPDEILFGVSGKMAKLRLNEFGKVVGMCPAARHFTKRWPAERYAELGARVALERDAAVLLFGGAEDVPLCAGIARAIADRAGTGRSIDLSGQLSLLEVAAAMQYCDAVVTNDSGLMHIAVAMHRRVVAIFGSTVRELGFFPYTDDAVVIERRDVACRPCSHIGRPSCPKKHFLCMLDIGVEEVFSRTGAVLDLQ